MARIPALRSRWLFASSVFLWLFGQASGQPSQEHSAGAPPVAPAPSATPAPPGPQTPSPLVPSVPAAAAAPLPAPTPTSKHAIPHESYQLHNGLRVILQQDSRLPFVTVCVVYHVGAYHEVSGKSGLAHLFEHLMFEGSRGTLPHNAVQTLSEMGVVDANGITSWDQTIYYETIPAINLESALWMEADRMQHLTGAENTLYQESARSIVKNERRQRIETVAYAGAYAALAMNLFAPPHPYARDVIGSFDDLDRATTKDLREFYKTWYGPNNATLLVLGDVLPGEARQLVSKYFGPIERRGTPINIPPPVPALTAAVKVQTKDAIATVPALIFGWSSPPIDSPDDPIGDVAAIILQARLHRRLVQTLAVATGVAVEQQSRLGHSLFRVTLLLRSLGQLKKAQGLADAVLEELRQDTTTEDEVGLARLRLITDHYWKLEEPLSRALALARWTRLHPNIDMFREELATYRRMTPTDVGRFVREYLRPESRVLVEVEPQRRQVP